MPDLSLQSLSAALSPEAGLLVSCARTETEAENGLIRTLLQEHGIDWTYLVDIALIHGMMPVLYRRISTVCPELVPKEVLHELQGFFHQNALRNRMLAGELVRLLGLFKEHGITAVPYKGPLLAVSVYGDLALRQFGDLDIVIHKRDFPAAKELLVGEGYSLKITDWERSYAKYLFHYEFVSSDGDVHVELHWGFAYSHSAVRFDLDALMERLVPYNLAGATLDNFSWEDVLLALCIHGTNHYWNRLIWICDVAAVIGISDAIHWRGIMDRAAGVGGDRMLILGLLLARDLFGVVLPDEVVTAMYSDKTAVSLASVVRKSLFSGRQRLEERPACYELRLRRSLRYKLWYLSHNRFRVMKALLPGWALLPFRFPGRLSRFVLGRTRVVLKAK